MAEPVVGLADAVKALRSELDLAVKEGAGEAIRFELGKVEMEFLVEVAKEGGAEAGVKFWVLSVGAKGSVTSTATHRVTLELTPKVGGRPAEIADTEPGE